MRRAGLILLVALGLTACQTTAPAGLAPNPGRFEVVAQTQVEPGRWRISLTAPGRVGLHRLGVLLLQRAAALTLSQGYDWFRITERYVGGEESARSAVRAAGTIEILMGRGAAPTWDPDAFDARQIRRTVGQSA